MSYGIGANVYVFVSHVGKSKIDGEIESCNDMISMHEKELCIMVGMNPRDMVSNNDKSDGSIAEVVRMKIDELLDSYREEVIKLYKLELLKESINDVVEG